MRQRKVKNLPEKYAVYEDILEYHPERNKGRWISVLEERGFTVKGAPQVEIGCGKQKRFAQGHGENPGQEFEKCNLYSILC